MKNYKICAALLFFKQRIFILNPWQWSVWWLQRDFLQVPRFKRETLRFVGILSVRRLQIYLAVIQFVYNNWGQHYHSKYLFIFRILNAFKIIIQNQCLLHKRSKLATKQYTFCTKESKEIPIESCGMNYFSLLYFIFSSF